MPTLHTKPGFEWIEDYGPGEFVRLSPVRRDHVFDTVNECYFEDIRRRGGWFFATARPERDRRDGYALTGWWKVTTQAGHNGGRRHRFVQTEEEAKQALQAWYWRRFRYADESRPNNNR